ncbi:hypothetical protein [Streptomyces antarcticus]|uniref:hypothetical protein n=1 Tax=Streptomyces antarcticus TaxID=2996458 RepID=UPI00226F9C28|nr:MULTISPECIES: hypothetical protein [unclassified Streptomyces]MCY0942630.1 hypothetical protein [Streptomyces sp. H34-AA3]MCZ4081376.1 hypothetical protein [Streptomyces sp. H34-S5]
MGRHHSFRGHRYVTGVPGGDTITVRQLAGMRSGLFDYAQDRKFLAGLRADPNRVYTPCQLVHIAFGHACWWRRSAGRPSATTCGTMCSPR